jgi:hypothetical protein
MPSDAIVVNGMQEVWGSNSHSSTSQVKAMNSNSRREAAFLFRAPVPSSAASGESANEQVKASAIGLRIEPCDLLHCRQAIR